ncbi:Flp pilus assembly protein CpaB [Streptomyces sp. RKND-216]|uniref:Flp pilus assembly protein CpaB n=1 Tax=Streptomyces sp. RKND-216 TaxID=2562581 RepID=UPI00109E343E|nr:Flp pilus assembly protein CpaB [Streptomyces sp. RKND-216]THA24755.1 Flp pilus assembly protein CpaB [Streptomyces sp. RKND-216]
MNSRQRRGVLLIAISALCALGAFAGVLAVIRQVQSKVGPEVTAYELKADIAAYETIGEDDVRRISMPERWLPETAVTDLGDLRGRIAVNPLRQGSLLQSDMMAERPALEAGQQEIAIMIDAATGVAGKINPGDEVNVYATFDGDRDGEEAAPDQSRLIVTQARVIDVGELAPFEDDDSRSRAEEREGVPITFALSTRDAQRVAYAESFAEHVRLALVAPGSEPVPEDERVYSLAGDR